MASLKGQESIPMSEAGNALKPDPNMIHRKMSLKMH